MENTIDMKTLSKQFSGAVEEIEKMKRVKERYIEYAKQLQSYSLQAQELSKNILNLAKEIDPVLTSNGARNTTKLKPILQEIYQKMLEGTHVTAQFVETVYPNLTENQHKYLLTNLKKMKDVSKTRDGKTIRLYI